MCLPEMRSTNAHRDRMSRGREQQRAQQQRRAAAFEEKPDWDSSFGNEQPEWDNGFADGALTTAVYIAHAARLTTDLSHIESHSPMNVCH